ncbi:hypothetical protein N7451_002827 [Penicillium sp. IBT 35674x]|nr:hypothetical protein N7451_002827 [Penicillium sp. IBT 35674x]
MGLDIPADTPNKGPSLEAFYVFFLVITTLMTLIRIVSKVVTKQHWWWDDLLALASWIAEVILLSLLLSWVHLGLGLHEDFIAAQNELYLVRGAKIFYVAIFFFDTSICLPKLSALFFYARVFNTKDRVLRNQLWILGSLVIGWLLSAYFVTIWQCNPIPRAWNTTIPGKCVDTVAWYTATAAISFAIDIWILIIPIPLIWRLKTSLRRRIYLLVAFFLTYSVIVVSIGRLVATIQIIPNVAEDETWRMATYMYWAGLEGSLSIISISVPNAIALVKHLRGHQQSVRHSKSDSSRLTYDSNRSQNTTSIHRGGPSISENSDKLELVEAAHRDAEMALGEIRIKTDIRVD